MPGGRPVGRARLHGAPVADEGVLDLGMMATLDEVGALDDAWRLLTETTPARLDALAAAVDAADRQATRKLAHGLKGASLQCGARVMGELCREIEHTAGQAPFDALVDQVARLRLAWDAAQQAKADHAARSAPRPPRGRA